MLEGESLGYFDYMWTLMMCPLSTVHICTMDTMHHQCLHVIKATWALPFQCLKMKQAYKMKRRGKGPGEEAKSKVLVAIVIHALFYALPQILQGVAKLL